MTSRSEDLLVEHMRVEASDVCSPTELLARVSQTTAHSGVQLTSVVHPAAQRTRVQSWTVAVAAAVVVVLIAIGAVVLGGSHRVPRSVQRSRDEAIGRTPTADQGQVFLRTPYRGPVRTRTIFRTAGLVAEPPNTQHPHVKWRRVYDGCKTCGPHGHMTIYLAVVTHYGRHIGLAYISVVRNGPCPFRLGGPLSEVGASAQADPSPQTQGCTRVTVFSAATGKPLLGMLY